VKAVNLYCNWKLMVMTTNLYYHCWFARAGLVLFLFVFLFLFFSVAQVVLFHNSTHTTQNIHTETKNKSKQAKGPQDPQIKTQNKKQKERIKQRGHKDLKQSYIEQKIFFKKKREKKENQTEERRMKRSQRKKKKLWMGKGKGERGRKGKVGGRERVWGKKKLWTQNPVLGLGWVSSHPKNQNWSFLLAKVGTYSTLLCRYMWKG